MKINKLLLAGLHAVCLSIIADGADMPLVRHDDNWQFHKGTNAPQSAWQTIPDSALDASWGNGAGGFGYADNPNELALVQTQFNDMRNRYTTVHLRRSFDVTNVVDASQRLSLTVDWDDGFIAWLDGAYLASANSPGAPAEPAFTDGATSEHESSRGSSSSLPAVAYDLGPAGSRLGPGAHVLSIVILNAATNSSDLILIADLDLKAPGCPPGMICGDTNWTAAGSPYAVTNNLTVAAGATLTVGPGVTVLFSQGVGLTVSGRLLAEGNETNRNLFTRATGAANWRGITINGGVGSPETRISYTHLEFNGSTAIRSTGGAVLLDHLTFGSTDHQYVSLDNSSFVVSDCVFPSATTPFEMLHGTGGIREDGWGVFLRNFFGVPMGYSDAVDFTGGNRPGPIVQFINNVFVGATDDILDLDGTDAWVEGNIFLHSHKNGAPDSSAAVSGGDSGTNTSEVTIIGNLFFDCDQAATAKEGNFFTLINNTIVHTTKTGGLDTESGVVCVRDLDPTPTTFGAGFYLEGNVIVDAEQLVRNYDPAQTIVTLNNNILPSAWNGPGSGNIIADPLLKHIPQLPETVFTNWAGAQVMRDWFSLLPGSPALGTGPNGLDQGGVVPLGASISGEPGGTTSQTTAILAIGPIRSGNSIPPEGWPDGTGYTHFKWRLDGGSWSVETPATRSITLGGLVNGTHLVEVAGKRDSGLYQDDPMFGADAVVTRSRTWTVNGPSFVVSGTLSSNTTWTPLLGEIQVIADVVVPTNVTLSISPGTVVSLTNDVSIIAESGGTIDILGSGTNKVFFSRLNGRNNWGQLSARGTNASLTVRHAEIEGGQTSVFTNATGLFEDSYFHDYGVIGVSGSATAPILLTQFAGPVTVSRCHFREYYEAIFRYGLTTVEDSLFENIHGDGIDFDFAVPGSVIRRCTLRHGNGTNIDAVDIGSSSRGVVIEQCLMYDFPFDKGVSIGEQSGDITVRNCVIYNVESGVAVKDSSVASIYNNTIVSSEHGLRLYEKISGAGGGNATAYNNIIWGNTNSISLTNGSTLSVSYSDISGFPVYPGTSNLNVDPIFLGAAQNDYRLAANSPCLGAGLGGTTPGALLPPGSLLVDTDDDGLPDPWEWGNRLDFNDPADAGLDADGDRRTNFQEYLSGTDPQDATSYLKFGTISRGAGSVAFQFTAAAGRSYSVEHRDDAVQGLWLRLEDVASATTNRVVSVTDMITAGEGIRLYRLVTPALP